MPEDTGGATGLEPRLERLERRLDRLEAEVDEAGVAPPGRQLEELRQRLRDLAERQRRLGEDLAAVLDLVDPERGGEPMASTATPSSGAPSASPLRAMAKLALRAPAAALRRLRRGALAEPPEPLVIEVGEPAGRLPEIAVVRIVAEGAGDDLASSLERSSESPREIVSWDPAAGSYAVREPGGNEPRRGTADSPEALVEALESDFLAQAGGDLSGLASTALELAGLTLAGEPLDFLELPPGRGGKRLCLVRRRLWRPGAGLDELARSHAGRGAPLLGKVVGPDPRGPAPSVGFVEVGPYLLTRGRGPRLASHRHRLRPLGALEAAPDAGQPSVVLVTGEPLTDGRDRLAADLLRRSGSQARFLLFAAAASGELQAERLRHLELFKASVYPLGDYLLPELLPQAAALLARRHRARAFLELGGAGDGGAVAAALVAAGLRQLDPSKEEGMPADLVWCGVDPDALRRAATREAGEDLRRRLEIPAGAIVVAMASDLEPLARPEDFLALARRLTDDERFFFVLVGRGPLAGTLDDLERYLAPRRWRRLATAPLAEVLAAADVAIDTAEERPLPYFALSALATGRPVVACAPLTAALLAAEGCGLAAPVGEIGRLAEAVARLAEPALRADLGERGRRLVERRFTLDGVNERYRKLFAAAVER